MKQMKTNQTEFLCNNLLLSSSITKGAHMRCWDKKKNFSDGYGSQTKSASWVGVQKNQNLTN